MTLQPLSPPHKDDSEKQISHVAPAKQRRLQGQIEPATISIDF
jgi:hypothetical protein